MSSGSPVHGCACHPSGMLATTHNATLNRNPDDRSEHFHSLTERSSQVVSICTSCVLAERLPAFIQSPHKMLQ